LCLWVSTDPTGGAGGWSHTAPPKAASMLSCPTAGICVLATSGELETTTDAGSASPHWTQTPLPAAQNVSDLSCTSSLLCVAVDSGGDAFAGDPTGGPSSWATARIGVPTASLSGVSCQAGGSCLAVDRLGRVLSGRVAS
jgi:hypothetical protein